MTGEQSGFGRNDKYKEKGEETRPRRKRRNESEKDGKRMKQEEQRREQMHCQASCDYPNPA